MRGETMKNKLQKNRYSTTFGVDPVSPTKTYRLKNLHRTAHEKNTFLYGRKNGRTHIASSEKKQKAFPNGKAFCFKVSQLSGLNWRPDDYKSTALPTELSWRNCPTSWTKFFFFGKSFYGAIPDFFICAIMQSKSSPKNEAARLPSPEPRLPFPTAFNSPPKLGQTPK